MISKVTGDAVLKKSQVCGLTKSRKKMCRVNLEKISILIWEWGKSKRKTEVSRKVEKLK